ncbi:MAG: hypothetical protein AAFO73_07115 [Pseudomonadota bacterium]
MLFGPLAKSLLTLAAAFLAGRLFARRAFFLTRLFNSFSRRNVILAALCVLGLLAVEFLIKRSIEDRVANAFGAKAQSAAASSQPSRTPTERGNSANTDRDRNRQNSLTQG